MRAPGGENGFTRLQPTLSLKLATGAAVVFKPGGPQLVLADLHEPLHVGTSFPLTLRFSNDREITVPVTVDQRAPNQETGHPRQHEYGS